MHVLSVHTLVRTGLLPTKDITFVFHSDMLQLHSYDPDHVSLQRLEPCNVGGSNCGGVYVSQFKIHLRLKIPRPV